MMEALKVMTYFKVSLSTCNWDSAKEKGTAFAVPSSHLVQSLNCHAPCNP